MESLITLSVGKTYLLLLIFGLSMLAITFLYEKWRKYTNIETFLVGERKVGWLFGGSSIAASWIWAPAVFVSSLFAYTNGLAGLFWFVAPNILALALFALLAPRIRERMPYGYTLPQWIQYKLGSEKVHKIYLFPFFFYQLMAITVQLFAGGNLLALLLGIPVYQATAIVMIALLGAIPLVYSLVSGLESSIITDFVQLILVLAALIIIIPWTISSAGVGSIINGLSGIKGSANIFNPYIAFSLGIVTSIGLFAGAVSDQQYWQRGFAIKKGDLRKALIFGVLVVGKFLPAWAGIFFVIMLLCALSSTLDSGMNAATSLFATDVMKYTDEEKTLMLRAEKGEPLSDREKLRKHILDARRLSGSRSAMIFLTILGFLVALGVIFIPGFGLTQLWWVFNTIAACVMVPTILSLYWERLDARGVFYGVVIAFFIGLPIFIYSNIINKPIWIVASSLFIVGITLIFCILFPRNTPLTPGTKVRNDSRLGQTL